MSIDEAAWVVKEFLGPYTGEEHSKRENIVCGPCMNRVCSGHGVRLSKHEDFDDERRKKKTPASHG